MRVTKLLAVLVLVLSAHPDAQVAHLRYVPQSSCVGTAITTSDDVGALAAAGSTGQTFCIAAGTHRQRSVTPKQDQKFIGVPGAIMTGAKLLTSPSGSGPWTYSSQTQHNTEQGTCRSGDAVLPDQPMCQNPEDLWIDGVLQHHVATVGEVTVGTSNWFFNYSTDVITIGTNPSGKTIETSVTDLAFISEGGVVTGVVIQGLIIEKYATPGGKGTISAPNGQQWIVRNNEIRYNHSTGVGLGDGGQVLNNNLHHNGQNGIGAYDASNLIIRSNESAYNGALFDPFWGAGGMKVAFIDNSLIQDNYVHHNYGPGIWCDIDCKTITITDNISRFNDQAGIFYEISFDALIYNNVVTSNGFNAGPGPAQAGIFIAASQNVAVYSNTVQDNAWGIYAYQEVRGTSIAYSPLEWEIENLNVHDNIVKTAGRVGLEQAESDTSYFTSRNNHFEADTYTLSGATTKFSWDDANSRSFATWQGYGNDSPSGSASTYGAIAHIASGGANSNSAGGSSTTAVSGSVNTTGATLLVMACGQYYGGGTSGSAVASDSKGNTWVPLTAKPDDLFYSRIRIFYVNSATPTVGTGHTFTCTGLETYGEVMYAAFSGTTATPFDVEAVSQNANVTSLGLVTPGLIPTTDGQVIIAAMSIGSGSPTASSFSVDSGMTLAYSAAEAAGTTGAAWAYKIQAGAAPIIPTFSWTTGTTSTASIAGATFKAAP